MNERYRFYGRLAISLGLLGLAVSFIILAREIHMWRKAIPDILDQAADTAERLGPLIKTINESDLLISPILEEVSASRKVLSETVEEVRKTREQLPGILKEIEPITRQIENTALELPKTVEPVIAETAKTRELIPDILDEIKQTRETVPDILDEVKQTREAIPGMLDRADKIVLNAQNAGEEAGKGAVSGMFSGIVSMPFNIAGKLGKSAVSIFSSEDEKLLTIKDIKLMQTAMVELAEKGKIGEVKTWKNKSSSNSGRITLLEIYKEKGRPCRQIKIETFIKGVEPRTALIRGCRLSDGSWTIMEGVLPDSK